MFGGGPLGSTSFGSAVVMAATLAVGTATLGPVTTVASVSDNVTITGGGQLGAETAYGSASVGEFVTGSVQEQPETVSATVNITDSATGSVTEGAEITTANVGNALSSNYPFITVCPRLTANLIVGTPFVFPNKKVGEKLDYQFNWNNQLLPDTIASVAVISSGSDTAIITEASPAFENNVVSIWIEGGTAGDVLNFTCGITSQDGRIALWDAVVSIIA